MEKVRGKFYCNAITTKGESKTVQFFTLYSNNPEDNSFAKSTPSGQITMVVDNPAAQPFFEEGKHYYVDFTKAN